MSIKMSESERKHVIDMLRACLLSVKGGIPTRNLERDYEILVGTRIPFQKLGYKTLEQFLKSIPDVSVSHGRNGELILDAIPTKSSEHLAALVSKQKAAPKRSTRSLPPRRTAASSWRPPPTAMKPSRRPVSPRVPLSVTVSNRGDRSKGASFEKPSRLIKMGWHVEYINHTMTSGYSIKHENIGNQVNVFTFGCNLKPKNKENQPVNVNASGDNVRYESIETQEVNVNTYGCRINRENIKNQEVKVSIATTMSSTSTSQNNSVNTGGRMSHHSTFEKPPRFLRMAQQQENNVPAPLPAPVPTPVPVSIPTPVVSAQDHKTKKSNAQDRLQHAVSAPVTNLNLVSNSNVSTANIGGRTITSPLTPLHARLNAASRKSHLTIDDFRISSYPDEKPTPEEAMQQAAKQALDELNKLSSVIGGSATQDENTIMSRVSHIVGEHRNGIWSSQIPLDYNQKYNEILPDDWLKIMSRCPLVSLQHVAENRIIITPNWPSEPPSPVATTTVNPMEQTHVRPILSPIGFAVPEQIMLPPEDVWDVFITCGNATDEIWVRLIGDDYSVQYENLATDMEMFYMGKSNVAINPEVGLFYAIKMDDCWHRVKLVEINETGSVGRVFFIDHGDEEVAELKDLHVLERRFAKLPAQAILCYLWGLEDFVDDPNSAKHITENIVGKTMIASVKSRAHLDSPAHGVILFDTSTNEDLNMNSILIENISKEAMAPQLPLEGLVKEVYISHVTATGDIFLQFDSYSYLQTLIADVIGTGFKENDIQKGSQDCTPNPSRLYLARYHLDDNWYRAAITKKLEGKEEVEITFVDFGNTEIISPTNLFLIETVKKSLADFPHQAVKVHLHKVKMEYFGEKMVQRLRELAPPDERVLVKTVSSGHTSFSVPEVEIFKRIQPDNLLVSICDTLALDPDLRPSPTEDSTRGKKRLDRIHSLTSTADVPVVLSNGSGLDSKNFTASRGLSPPQIPEIGEYFDVHVTMAANPGNFTVMRPMYLQDIPQLYGRDASKLQIHVDKASSHTAKLWQRFYRQMGDETGIKVQPYKDATRLEKMMEDMQSHYIENKYPHPTPENVHEGGLYAALHNDNHWYRVCVSNVINGNMVSVYFCDYGDVSVLTLDKLQPLTNQFKELPYQAIKAKLAGIQPKHSDWSVEDCLLFQDLVVEHQFVSVVMETGPDLLNPSDTVIGLTLIDTSGEEDVYIDKVLVAQKRADVTPVS
ncbi:hypothetical protein C0J52_11031 [Blattella germanica]|nr:hypothetical protein C0J52_11031 [Blattella germanica]